MSEARNNTRLDELHKIQDDSNRGRLFDDQSAGKTTSRFIHTLDDLDSEQEEEEGQIRRQIPRKRIKRRAVDAFIDCEAEVDDYEEDAEDDKDEQVLAEGFIENGNAEGRSPFAPQDDARHRALDQQQCRFAGADAARLAAQYKARYGQSRSAYKGSQKSVPQRLLLPSVEDASIWGIRCKPGKENEIVCNLLRKQAAREHTVSPLQIISVFAREHLRGYLYVEARRPKDVMDALADVVNVYLGRKVLVPVAEMPDLLRIRYKGTTLVPGAYVRIEKNNKRYAGDLGRINNISIDNTEAFVQLVPRLDYSSQESLTKKTLRQVSDRPPARLFNPTDVERIIQKSLPARRADNSFKFLGNDYQDGFLNKNFKVAHLITDPEEVLPSLEEMQSFSSADTLDLASLRPSLSLKAERYSFTIGDTAEISSGEQSGVHGLVESISKNVVGLRTADEFGLGIISVPTSGLRKRFTPGNLVRVQSGKHTGESGSVVAIHGDTVTLLTSMGMAEITVFSRDLGEVSEVSEMPTQSRFEVRDVVEVNATEFGCVIRVENVLLQLLMSTGDVKTIKADSVARKIEPSKFSRTTDRNGSSVQISNPQSTVREVSGKNRKGKVFNIHRNTVFCHNIELVENNGIFVARIRDVEIDGMARVRIDFSKQKPNISRPGGGMAAPNVLPKTIGRDKAVGQTTWIRTGPQKGLMGIVTDTTDDFARIEPHDGLKKISVKKELIGFRLAPNQPPITYAEFIHSKGWNGSAGMPPRESQDSTRPIWAQVGNRGPSGSSTRASIYGSGSRTPAWAGAGGSRTPAWSLSGAKTPVWADNTTPSWNTGGSKT